MNIPEKHQNQPAPDPELTPDTEAAQQTPEAAAYAKELQAFLEQTADQEGL